jgi:hypothetical protein
VTILQVKVLPPDDFSRPRLQDVNTGMKFVDVDFGIGNIHNIPGYWHTVSGGEWEEPEYPLKKEIKFELVTD